MKVTILGSGSCYGVPTIGNDWGDCDPTNSKNRRTVASVVVETATTKILIDMGPDFREQSIRHDLTDLDAILFTHGHPDHVLGNFYLPRLMQYYKDQDLPLYADRETQQEIERMFWFQMGKQGDVQFSYGGTTHWETIEPFRSFRIGDLDILPFPQNHGAMTSFGFRIGDFAYSTDFESLPPDSEAVLNGLSCWIVECNRRYAKTNVPHLHLQRVLDMVTQFTPQRTYLTHLNISMDYDTISAELPPAVALAYDGLELDL